MMRKNLRSIGKSLSTLLIILSLVWTGSLLANGIVVNRTFFSTTLNQNRLVRVYLPEGYSASDTVTHYPVVIFLHGGYVNTYSYPSLTQALDQTIWTGATPIPSDRVQPMIVVIPDGNSTNYGGLTWWSNSILNGDFADYVTQDLVNWVADNYHTFPHPSGWALLGHSMGGYGAMSIAMRNPDLFGAVSTLGGLIDLQVSLAGITPWILEENASNTSILPNAGVWSEILYSMSAAFSPNLDQTPEPVDLPINFRGHIIQSVWDQWELENPTYIARTLTPGQLAIYTQCGVNDELWIDVNRAFSDSLETLGLPHRFDEFIGDHNNALAQRLPFSLVFFDSVFTASASSSVSPDPIHPVTFELAPPYPNPFNPTTTIRYSQHQTADIHLVVYDLRGRVVRTLISARQSVGEHEVMWDGRDDRGAQIATGMYFARLQGQGVEKSVKMISLK